MSRQLAVLKMILRLWIAALAISVQAQSTVQEERHINGFLFGNTDAPTGKEGEFPEDHSLNKESPRAILSFASTGQVCKVLTDHSEYRQSIKQDDSKRLTLFFCI